MSEFVGKICPVCKQEINELDKVTVCPDCGIPHHTDCWEMNAGCSTFGCAQQGSVKETKAMATCSKCGTVLEDGQEFCPKCGTPKNAPKKNVCGKCGAELQDGQEFCPKCGQKVGLAVDSNVSSAINQFNAGVDKKNNKKKIIPFVAAGLAIVAIIVFFVLRGPSVDEVVLAKDSIEMKAGNTQSVSYTINPDKAADKAKVTWKSSNESVAKVDENGKITAKGDGSCTITITAGGKTDTVTVTVKSGPDFKSIYDKYCQSSWASVGSDGSYLSIDTNPYDTDDHTDYDALSAIFDVNSALGLPESLEEDMLKTTAMMGRQSETYNAQGVSVSWSYHPDKGMEITYKSID